jgi:hypothetical protein
VPRPLGSCRANWAECSRWTVSSGVRVQEFKGL